jgi:mono/diheme cytochrome c family protein
MRVRSFGLLGLAAVLALSSAVWLAPRALGASDSPSIGKSTKASIERGRYLVKIGGCNDCHTAGYAPAGGRVPEAQWLTGDQLGFRGPWGTSYPTNLRLYMQKLSEDDWVKVARSFEPRPPMPWYDVRAMSERDQRAIYRYVRGLGPAGSPAPEALPPNVEPKTPVIAWPAPPK